jgi:hypothetical protein
MSYADFLASKRLVAPAAGRTVEAAAVNPTLFGFQQELVRWAVRKGRAALFADTGLGKSRMQVEWARLLGERTLIIAPLGVTRQTVREAATIGVEVRDARRQADAGAGISITNYEMAEHFDADAFGAVVLDESSILKALAGATRQRLTQMFAQTPYRLCCTATPAPNDITEIANHAEFLGLLRRMDMLASFFVHDDAGWRLKGHAEQPFYRWLASWAMAVRRPSDLGYADDGYLLPPLSIRPLWVDAAYVPDGQLFFTQLRGVGDRTAVRRSTLEARVAAAAELVNAEDEPWICWCGLNEESRALAAAIPSSVEVRGTDSADEKAAAIAGFVEGRYRVLVTKPRIAGWGLNLQHCARMVFVGLSDSWESYYQCLRRCYRFGQTRPVQATIVLAHVEDAVYQNVMDKEREAARMSEHLIAHVRDFERAEIAAAGSAQERYETAEERGAGWRLLLGDSAERLAELADESVDLSVFSPPFMSLYTYSPTERDVGNCTTSAAFFEHFGYIIAHLLRVTRPGRLACVHVAQVPAMLERDGFIGLKDFRGQTIEAFTAWGWIHHGEVCIDKDPQAQAIRTKSKALLFVQVHKDSSWSRPALADYILVFRKPGANVVPIVPDLSNDEWIEWARPIWYGIKESDTLQYSVAREDDDERHICPLQLGTIERCIRLWSNRGETVLDPFAGIGSTLYQAVLLGRRGLGCELKRSYFETACRYLREAEARARQPTLFDGVEGTWPPRPPAQQAKPPALQAKPAGQGAGLGAGLACEAGGSGTLPGRGTAR